MPGNYCYLKQNTKQTNTSSKRVTLAILCTLISSFTVFCGFTSKIKNRMKAFLLNLLSAFLQMLTFLVILGWIWSILWGMNFIQIAMNADKKDKAMLTPYYCRRQSSVDVPIL
ncbi:hypothetical protein ACJMK2_037020 [Sinanodonta woodiana]|uniref:Uncharacterized protein n=1 Tax=Sinanodonta woodiana TaxID=1069815 RepID=A0ABD3WMJ7_SINWO